MEGCMGGCLKGCVEGYICTPHRRGGCERVLLMIFFMPRHEKSPSQTVRITGSLHPSSTPLGAWQGVQ